MQTNDVLLPSIVPLSPLPLKDTECPDAHPLHSPSIESWLYSTEVEQEQKPHTLG